MFLNIADKIYKQISKLSKIEQDRVFEVLDKLKSGFIRYEKLEGNKNQYKIKVGKIRIIIKVDFKSQVIDIEKVKNRCKVYKDL